MKKPTYISSNTYSIICPCCGIDELEHSVDGVARCSRCDRAISTQVLKTLAQIVSLPDAIGRHACECGHPEMRRLPDGVFHCSDCGSEVLPLEVLGIVPALMRMIAYNWSSWFSATA